MKLLVIEDSSRLRKAIVNGLIEEGYQVDSCEDGAEGLGMILARVYDVVILDIMLPSMNGLNVLKKVREQGNQTNVIFLTAKTEFRDRLDGLESGADDYINKPFAFAELLEKVESLGSQSIVDKTPIINIGDLEINLSVGTLFVNGTQVVLSPQEFKLFECFMLNRGQRVSFKQMNQLLDEQAQDVLETHITNLRKKLKSFGFNNLIKTHPSDGFYIDKA